MKDTVFHQKRFPSMPSQYLFTGGLAVLLVTGLASFFLPYTVDDAFITYRYAHHLSTGTGPVFNPGERVEGYTSFLWMLLLSVGQWLTLDPIVVSKVTGLVSTLVAAGIVFWAVFLVSSHPRQAGFISLFFLLLSADVALNSVTGLETTFFMLWITAAVARSLWEQRHDSLPWSSILFGLATLTRPEGLAFFGLHLIYQLVVTRQGAKPILLQVVLFLLLVAPHWLWRISYYGELLPATYYAKQSPLLHRLYFGGMYLGDFALTYGSFFLASAVLAILQGARRLWYPLWMSVGGLAIVWWEGGDWMAGHRFLVPTIPIWCLITGEVLSTAYNRIAHSIQPSYFRWSKKSLPLIVLLLTYACMNGIQMYNLNHYARVRSKGYRDAHLTLAGWLSDRHPAGSAVALMDVGMMGYYTDFRIIDLTGLTDITIARAPGRVVDKVYDPGYVLAQNPVAIVLVSIDEDLQPDFPIERRLYADDRFQETYTLDHTLEHYHDAKLGDYTLLVYVRKEESE